MNQEQKAERSRLVRNLTSEGREELGHIFPHGYVPLKQYTPLYANVVGLRGKQQVWLIDWEFITELQRIQVAEYIAAKFEGDAQMVHRDLEEKGFVPVQYKYIIESYDLRFLV